MPHPTWRQEIGRWIAEALAEGQRRGLVDKDPRRFVRETSRGGLWAGGAWAVKIWREEFRYQVKGVRRPDRRVGGRPRPVPAEGQGSLFGED
jgi:hypothetical protein